MIRFLHFTLAVSLLAVFAHGAVAQTISSGLIPPPMLARYGLVRVWHTQVELDAAQARVGDVRQHVSVTQGITYIDVVLAADENQKFATITDRQLDAFGKPFGPAGAKTAADEKIAELNAVGVAAKPVTHVVPEITIYATTDNGFLHAIDGESGATKWVVPVGSSKFPTFAPAANDQFVAAINGVTLYVFEAGDGRLAWSRRLNHAPGAGPAVTNEFVHVPMVPGQIESFPLVESKVRPRIYQSFGRAVLQPVTTPSSLLWATDRGFLYVGNGDEPGIRFRLETQDEIVARPTWLAPNLVVGVSLDGDVYGVNEFTGSLLWRFSTGDPIGHSPIAVDNDVYVITNNHVLFRISADTGGADPPSQSDPSIPARQRTWTSPAVAKFLAASKERLYCLDPIGRLMILDRATGGRLVTLPINIRDTEVLNDQTDRLFFVNKSGLIQCFREIGLEYPLIHAGAITEADEPPQVQQQGLAPPKTAPPAEGAAPPDANPFGGGAGDPADPFGGAGAEKPDPADPFGGAGAEGAAPKKEATPAASDDPFGSP